MTEEKIRKAAVAVVEQINAGILTSGFVDASAERPDAVVIDGEINLVALVRVVAAALEGDEE